MDLPSRCQFTCLFLGSWGVAGAGSWSHHVHGHDGLLFKVVPVWGVGFLEPNGVEVENWALSFLLRQGL